MKKKTRDTVLGNVERFLWCESVIISSWLSTFSRFDVLNDRKYINIKHFGSGCLFVHVIKDSR